MACGMLRGLVGGQVGHPGRGLGLAVHDEQIPALPLAHFCVGTHPVRIEPPSRLGDVAQAGQVHVLKSHALEQIEGVGHSGEGCHLCGAGQFPETRVYHREIGQLQGRAHQEVAVHHTHPVAVGEGECGGGGVAGT